ncbi:MAG: NAD+ synthase [bacterium]|nr:NAD+ synthase [bacterium]
MRSTFQTPALEWLKINPALAETMLTGFIRDEVTKMSFSRVVLGLSGGVDSSLCALLAARALGPENVTALMMPYKSSSPESVEHARQVVSESGIQSLLIEITPMIDTYFESCPDADQNRRGNKMARERMTILYDHSALLGALVLGTSNKSELLLGYGTLYGDMASALNPIGDLYKSQVWQLAEWMGVPDEVVGKAPSADLWVGQTDEGELGFGYPDVDQLLYYLVDRRHSPEECVEAGFPDDFVRRVVGMVQGSQFKRRPPVIAKISDRTIEADFRYARDWGR